MKNAYSIITYQDEYKHDLVNMILNVYEDELWFTWYERPDIYYISTHYLRDPSNHFRIVLDKKKELIWCVAVQKKNEKLVYLRRMVLKKEFRGKGIWVSMLQTALTFAKKKWYKEIYAWTVKENKTAISFYTRQWFEPIDHAPHDITAAKEHICLKFNL